MNTHSSPIPLRPDVNALREAALTSLVRACLNIGRAQRDRFAKSAWPDDRTAELLTRAATSPTTFADAAALHSVAMFFVASLVPVSAAAQVIARSLQLSFGDAALISAPNLAMPNAAWLAEGVAIPVVQGTSTAGALIEPFKLATLLALSGEMIRNPNNAEAIMRQVLLENVGATLDIALFAADAAVPGVRPAGILNGIAPLAASSGTGIDAMVADIGNIAAALAPVAGGSQPMLIAAPRQTVALAMSAPRDLWPVLMSNALPDKTVIGIVPAALATAIEPPRIEASSDTVLHMDTAPADISAPGSPPVVAAPVISMFQTDSVSLRFILPATWARRSPAAVAWIEGTNW